MFLLCMESSQEKCVNYLYEHLFMAKSLDAELSS